LGSKIRADLDPNTLRDTHQFKKGKNETSLTYRGIKEILLPLNAPRLIDQAGTGRYGIELPASTWIVRVEAVENLVKF
jgi:hypothetical protein